MENWETSTTITLWLGLGLLLIAILLGFIWLFIKTHIKKIKAEEKEKRTLQLQHQKALLKNSVDIQEKERQRIAADIHDDLIGQIRGLMLQSNDAHITTKLKDIITKTRHISHDLYPPLISQLTLYELAQDLFHNLQDNYNIQLIKSGKTQLKDTQKLHLYRIIKELINNTVVHAKASSISLQLRYSGNAFAMVYYDSGIGIKSQSTPHLGMKNIEMRCNLMRARYKFKTHLPSGVKLILFLPYE